MKKLLGFILLFVAIVAFAANQNSTAILGSPSYLIESMANIVTAGSTTTLTSASLTKQAFTGSSAQTVQLPAGTSLQLGRKFLIINGSSNTITVNDAGSNLLAAVTGPSAEFTLKDNTTSNGTWSVVQVPSASSGAIAALTTDVVAGPGPTAAATIQPNVVTNAKLAQMAASSIKGNNTGGSANAADLTVTQTNTLLGDILADGTVAFSANQSMGSNKLTSVTDPTGAQDAATKNYVDSVASGLNPKQAVYAASTADIPGSYSNGAACVGAILTVTATGALSIDGVSPPVGSRVLLKNQSSAFQSGIYDVTLAGSLGISPILTRSLDYNTSTDMNAGDLIPVINGTVNAVTSWLQTSTISTCGSDSLTFTEWSYNPSSFLLKASNLSDVSSKSTSFNNLSPMTTLGDIIFGGASGTGTRLAPGSAGRVLTMNATQPTWSPIPAETGTVSSVNATVPAASILGVSGGPITSSGTLAFTTTGTSGGIPYFSSTSALSSSGLLTNHAITLGAGAGAAPYSLGSLGTSTTVLHGAAAGDPTFGAVSLTADISGTLSAVNGGTGQSSYAVGDIPYASATGTISKLAIGTTTYVLTSTGTLPAWSPAPAGGSVTSVAVTVPSDESVSGSPITTTGTIGITRNSQAANFFLAGPVATPSATPTYRAIVQADLPTNFMGMVSYAGTANCRWNTTNTGAAAVPSADTDCATASVTQGNGSLASAPATKIPAIDFTNLPAGTYKVVAQGMIGSDDACLGHWYIKDGTTLHGKSGSYNGSADNAPLSLEAVYTYTTLQSSIEFQVVFSRESGGGTCFLRDNDSRDLFEIWVQRI